MKAVLSLSIYICLVVLLGGLKKRHVLGWLSFIRGGCAISDCDASQAVVLELEASQCDGALLDEYHKKG